MIVKNFCEQNKITSHLKAGFLVHLRREEDSECDEATLMREYKAFCGIDLASFKDSKEENKVTKPSEEPKAFTSFGEGSSEGSSLNKTKKDGSK